MRIHIENLGRAKAAAKWLRGLTEKQVKGVPRLTLSKAQEAVAQMLGYSDWHELEQVTGTRPASPFDHEVGADERRARRLYQAGRLKPLGFADLPALAVVDILLPSGVFEREMTEYRDHALAGFRAAESLAASELPLAWYRHLYGVDAEAAEGILGLRDELGEGLVEAARRADVALSRKLAKGVEGYCGVVWEEKMLWQGYFLPPLDEEQQRRAEAAEQAVKAQLAETFAGPEGMLKMLEAMLMSGGAMPNEYVGALQSGIVNCAASGQHEGVQIFARMLAAETGLRFFYVRVDKVVERGDARYGIITSAHDLGGGTLDEARQAFDGLPEVTRIKLAVLGKFRDG